MSFTSSPRVRSTAPSSRRSRVFPPRSSSSDDGGDSDVEIVSAIIVNRQGARLEQEKEREQDYQWKEEEEVKEQAPYTPPTVRREALYSDYHPPRPLPLFQPTPGDLHLDSSAVNTLYDVLEQVAQDKKTDRRRRLCLRVCEAVDRPVTATVSVVRRWWPTLRLVVIGVMLALMVTERRQLSALGNKAVIEVWKVPVGVATWAWAVKARVVNLPLPTLSSMWSTQHPVMQQWDTTTGPDLSLTPSSSSVSTPLSSSTSTSPSHSGWWVEAVSALSQAKQWTKDSLTSVLGERETEVDGPKGGGGEAMGTGGDGRGSARSDRGLVVVM
jgi:hypothetical protein